MFLLHLWKQKQKKDKTVKKSKCVVFHIYKFRALLVRHRECKCLETWHYAFYLFIFFKSGSSKKAKEEEEYLSETYDHAIYNSLFKSSCLIFEK